MGVLLRGGTLVTAQDRRRADLLCREGRISAIGTGLEASEDDTTLDIGGCFVLPGGVDPHVHLDLPVAGTISSDDFLTGTTAAVAGGTTTVLDFVHPAREQDPIEALNQRKEVAQSAVCDVGLHLAVTWWGEAMERGIEQCVREEGITSFKSYMAYKDSVGLEDGELRLALERVAAVGGMMMVHAEDGDRIERLRDGLFEKGRKGPDAHPLSRPPDSEGDAVHQVATLARDAGTRLYIVHVTCKEALEALRYAREQGTPVHGETCPHYLLLDDSVYTAEFESAKYVLSPPLRAAEHQDPLWEAVRDGELQVVSTDHCPFNLQGQKALGRYDFRKIPGGAAGIEHRLSLLYTYGVEKGRLTLEQFVDTVSTAPAKLFGLYPQKGSLEIGADADLVVWDPTATGAISAKKHHHRCEESIYEGFELHGLPLYTLVEGEVRYADGELRVETGSGWFLRRGLPQG